MAEKNTSSSQEDLSELILGFQFEPERNHSDSESWETVEESDNEEEEQISSSKHEERVNQQVDKWCTCGNCVAMLTNKESLCCQDIDSLSYFELEGNILNFK